MEIQQREKPVRFIIKCKRSTCGAVFRYECLFRYDRIAARPKRDGGWIPSKVVNETYWDLVTGFRVFPHNEHTKCRLCGGYVSVRQVVGHLAPEVKCGAKCRNATGPNCDCACAGKNHGAGFPSVEN